MSRPTDRPALALPVTDDALAARLRERMDDVEEALAGHVRAGPRFVTEAASHLMDAGGKRFRPLLVLLAAEAGDHADVRRGRHRRLRRRADPPRRRSTTTTSWTRPTCAAAPTRRNARWDNHVAILTGDFLFSKSSELTADLGADAVRIQAQTFTRLVEGQILETVEPGPGEDPLDALPRGRRRQDRLADRHLRPLRRPLRRRLAARSRRR